MCGLYNYQLVLVRKRWEDARSYCKSRYTDLATLPLKIHFPRTSSAGDSLWIGLHRYPNENRTWHFSRPDLDFVETQATWGAGEPNNAVPPENCVYVENKTWVDHSCTQELPFFCYDGKNNCHYSILCTQHIILTNNVCGGVRLHYCFSLL